MEARRNFWGTLPRGSSLRVLVSAPTHHARSFAPIEDGFGDSFAYSLDDFVVGLLIRLARGPTFAF